MYKSKAAIARAAEISASYLCEIEKGKSPSVKVLARLAKVLQVHPWSLADAGSEERRRMVQKALFPQSEANN